MEWVNVGGSVGASGEDCGSTVAASADLYLESVVLLVRGFWASPGPAELTYSG